MWKVPHIRQGEFMGITAADGVCGLKAFKPRVCETTDQVRGIAWGAFMGTA